jgi:Flp pilus assembly pilin Flp
MLLNVNPPIVAPANTVSRGLADLISADDGATSIDYALLGVLVAVLVVAGLALAGDASPGFWSRGSAAEARR